jgi:hypothetical protein
VTASGGNHKEREDHEDLEEDRKKSTEILRDLLRGLRDLRLFATPSCLRLSQTIAL